MKDRKIEELLESEQQAASNIVTVIKTLMEWPEAAVITLVVDKLEESRENAKDGDEECLF